MQALEGSALGHRTGVDGGSGSERQVQCFSTMPTALLASWGQARP